MSHYIRLDAKNRIIAGFSDAFELPQSGDICILDDPQQMQRQFVLANQINPPLLDARGYPIYKYDASTKAVTGTTDADLSDLIQETAAVQAGAPPTVEERLQLVQSALDSLIMGGVTNG